MDLGQTAGHTVIASESETTPRGPGRRAIRAKEKKHGRDRHLLSRKQLA
jgi:hypothetical protein